MTAGSELHPQVRQVEQELAVCTTRAARLVDGTPEQDFHRSPVQGQWSVAQCLVHLNLTTRAYLPLIDDAMQVGRLTALTGPPRRYRRDLTGWLLCRMSEPPYRIRTTTRPRFVPADPGSRSEVLSEFVRLQQELTVRLYRTEGLHLGKIRIVSPFDGRLEYSLYSCFRILPAHQRRHLWQGEQVRRLLTLAPAA